MLPLLAVLLGAMLLILVCGLQLYMVQDWHAHAQGIADMAALAGASGFIDGDPEGDSVRARALAIGAQNTLAGEPAVIDSIALILDSGVVSVRVRVQTPTLIVAPGGIRLTVWATARTRLKDSASESGGVQMPPGNAWGWFRKDRERPATIPDTATTRLIR